MRTPRAALGTGAYAPLLRRLRRYLVPVYDYAMMTEPLRSAVIQLTRASLARADRQEGRRDLWLRTLDRLGLGFDS